MLSFILKLLGVVLLVIVVAHGYMYVRYDSLDACEAATNKVMSSVSEQQTLEGMAGTALNEGAGLARQRMQDGTLGCYRAVFLGSGKH